MIIGWIRLAFFVFLASTVAYVLLYFYTRSLRRERLEKQWEAEGRPGDHDAFVEAGMRSWEGGLKRRLLWLIYVLPMVTFSVTFFYVNWD